MERPRVLDESVVAQDAPEEMSPHERALNISEVLHTFNELGLGRPIYSQLSGIPNVEKQLIGMILPVREHTREHLIVLSTGEMLVTTPQDDTDKTQVAYDRFHNAREGYTWQVTPEQEDHATSLLMYCLYPSFDMGGSRISMSNLTHSDDEMEGKITAAIRTAHTLRDRRNRSLAGTENTLLRYAYFPDEIPETDGEPVQEATIIDEETPPPPSRVVTVSVNWEKLHQGLTSTSRRAGQVLAYKARGLRLRTV